MNDSSAANTADANVAERLAAIAAKVDFLIDVVVGMAVESPESVRLSSQGHGGTYYMLSDLQQDGQAVEMATNIHAKSMDQNVAVMQAALRRISSITGHNNVIATIQDALSMIDSKPWYDIGNQEEGVAGEGITHIGEGSGGRDGKQSRPANA